MFKIDKIWGGGGGGGGGMTAKKAIQANRFSEFFIRLDFWLFFHIFDHFWPFFTF